MSTVHVVLPVDVDDPMTPSGGNVYDRRVLQELARSGWAVREPAVDALPGLPDGALVLVDGLVAVAAAEELLRETARLRVVVLLHMPFGESDATLRPVEGEILARARAVLVTSEWSRRWLLQHYDLAAQVVEVAQPGVRRADLARGTTTGEHLLCVAAVTRDKGHQVLLTALAHLLDLPWRLTCVGSLSLDRELGEGLQRLASGLGIADRVTWTDSLIGEDLDKAWAAADLTVLASDRESWGMVVTESLARGVPVCRDPGRWRARGPRPRTRARSCPPVTSPRSRGSLRRWLCDEELRGSWRAAARSLRPALPDWSVTASKVERVLAGVAR